LEPYPNVISTLTKLIKKGIVIGVVTDAPRLKAWQRLNAMRMHNLFDIVITPDDAGGQKISQLPFEDVVKKIKMKPGEILFVGDSIERDMKGAKRIGMRTALAKYSSNEKTDPKIVDFVLNDIKDILDIIDG
jgi:putative hydrolase of the HAD superfamily